MFHFILYQTYLFSGTFFYVRFDLFENEFAVPYFSVLPFYLYVLISLVLPYVSCSNATRSGIVVNKGV
jgi:hypothetical protein